MVAALGQPGSRRLSGKCPAADRCSGKNSIKSKAPSVNSKHGVRNHQPAPGPVGKATPASDRTRCPAGASIGACWAVPGRRFLTSTLVRENLRFVETYERVLEALGDRTRRQIVDVLRLGPSSVGDLAARLPVSRPAISQHLTVLRHSHLVTYEEFGTRNVYRLDMTGLAELRAWTDTFWEAVLDSYAERVRADAASRAPDRPQAESAQPGSPPGPPQSSSPPAQKGRSDA
jgi:DNA-binding transcriptional ArsR family regulator